MIDIDEVGENKLKELKKATDLTGIWTDFEEAFLLDMRHRTYASLSNKQKALVGRLYDKLEES
jgi:hypothetical protein